MAWPFGPTRGDGTRKRAPAPSPTIALGDARFMTIDEAQRAYHRRHPAYGALVVGELYQPHTDSVSDLPFDPDDKSTWGLGGKAELMLDDCRKGNTHSIVTAGSGYFKTFCLVSSMFTWTGSTVVLDPSEELAAMVAAVRASMGHTVHVLRLETSSTFGFNALDWIDINSPTFETDVISVVEWICGYTPHHDQTAQFFKDSGKTLLQCFLADMLTAIDLDQEQKTLKELYAAVSVPEGRMLDPKDTDPDPTGKTLRGRLRLIAASSNSSFARKLAADLQDTVDQTFSGLRRNALEDTKWLAAPALANLVSGNSFRTADICNGKTDVFISLSLQVLSDVPAIGRTIVGALVNSAYQAKGKIWGPRTPWGGRRRGRIFFAIDEAWVLRNLNILAIARDAGRKYGITLQLIYQARSQMEYQWGTLGAESWDASVAWRSFAGIYDPKVAERISFDIGEHGVVVSTESVNSSWQGRLAPSSRSRGQSTSWHEVRRRVMTKEEILYGMRDDEQILFNAHGYPYRGGRAIAFRRDEMLDLLGSNQFYEDIEDDEEKEEEIVVP